MVGGRCSGRGVLRDNLEGLIEGEVERFLKKRMQFVVHIFLPRKSQQIRERNLHFIGEERSMLQENVSVEDSSESSAIHCTMMMIVRSLGIIKKCLEGKNILIVTLVE